MPDRRNHPNREGLIRKVQNELEGMGAVRLTDSQVRRLLNLDAEVCHRVLSTLVRDGALVRGADGRYSLPETHGWRTPGALIGPVRPAGPR